MCPPAAPGGRAGVSSLLLFPCSFLFASQLLGQGGAEGLSGCRREAEGTPETVGDICASGFSAFPPGSRLQTPVWEARCLVCHLLTFLSWPARLQAVPPHPLTDGGSGHLHLPLQEEGGKRACTFLLVAVENPSRLCQGASVGEPALSLPSGTDPALILRRGWWRDPEPLELGRRSRHLPPRDRSCLSRSLHLFSGRGPFPSFFLRTLPSSQTTFRLYREWAKASGQEIRPRAVTLSATVGRLQAGCFIS